MPPVMVYFYQESPGNVPVLDWLRALRKQDPIAFAAVQDDLRRLSALGSDLRRPRSAPLQDKLFELRTILGHRHFRLLFFFVPGGIAVVAHALTKQTSAVSRRDIETAQVRRAKYLTNPEHHRVPVNFDLERG